MSDGEKERLMNLWNVERNTQNDILNVVRVEYKAKHESFRAMVALFRNDELNLRIDLKVKDPEPDVTTLSLRYDNLVDLVKRITTSFESRKRRDETPVLDN